MTGSVTDLESPGPLDERDHFHDPVFPMTERYDPGNKVISKSELMIENLEEDPEYCFHRAQAIVLHKKRGFDLSQTLV